MIGIESLSEADVVYLDKTDQVWLDSFGVDPSWHQDRRIVTELNDVIRLGCYHLHKHDNDQKYEEVISAREMFMNFVGIDKATLATLRISHPAIVPLDTFINTQRTMYELGLDVVKIINTLPSALSYAAESVKAKVDNLNESGLDAIKIIDTNPSALSYAPNTVRANLANLNELGLNGLRVMNAFPTAISLAPESVKAKMANLNELGLNGVKVINAFPTALSYAPESVKAKIANLSELGLDAVKIINTRPSALSYAPESVKAKMANLNELGLNGVKVINAFPTALSYAPESVKAKLDNLNELGLDAAKIINTNPKAISLAPESVKTKLANLNNLGQDALKIINSSPATLCLAPETVRAKVILLDRLVRVLRWEYPTKELIEAFPAILGSKKEKLQLLGRIAAKYIDIQSINDSPDLVAGALYMPLEKYLLAVNNLGDSEVRINELRNSAKKIKLSLPERKDKVLELAQSGKLGRIGTMYLDYRK